MFIYGVTIDTLMQASLHLTIIYCINFPIGCLRFVIVVFPDHTHLLFFIVGYSLHYWKEKLLRPDKSHFLLSAYCPTEAEISATNYQ